MTTNEKIAAIQNPSHKETFRTTFSIATANMLQFEAELHKYGAIVWCAIKENNSNWLLSVEKPAVA